MNTLAQMPELSGLEQLRSVFNGDWKIEGIGKTMNFKPVTIEEGLVVFEGHPGREVYNPIGTVHGGYAATLLDSAVGCAVHSMLKAGQGYTTLELKVSYHRPLTEAS
ncbi:MAG TPA: PaaI family thioesterase, partial [Rhizomicrobium sp.]|nr:PaaI family thioesterase [Rhizomicrobium sp.]